MPPWAWIHKVCHTATSSVHRWIQTLSVARVQARQVAARYACPRRCPTQGASSRYQRRIALSAADSEASDVQQGLDTLLPVTPAHASAHIDDEV